MVAIRDMNVILVILLKLKSCCSQRKIVNGEQLQAQKRYLVYLKEPVRTEKKYDEWLCGGAIVSPDYIVTSAACVTDVNYMYAIAGYDQYVSSKDLDSDRCTSTMKKKIIATCVPRVYELAYEKVEKWSYVDIAVAKVESPYDFNDSQYLNLCSYMPNSIKINYDPRYQQPGTDAIVMGWGHVDKYRAIGDVNDYNQQKARYAPAMIQNKNSCKSHYTHLPDLQNNIDKYMICTSEPGNINDKGEEIQFIEPNADGCQENVLRSGEDPQNCNEQNKESFSVYPHHNITYGSYTRKHGICQNDHGGPLVSWVGAHEVLIGVASVFSINSKSECKGPYLYTSTQCNGAFLYCVINKGKIRRNSICDAAPKMRGFELVHRRVSWINHPDGPAENEMVKMRPQIPISHFG